ncbi:MAG: hypothetical protein ACYTG3_15945 [Planctomycetota bacterium]
MMIPAGGEAGARAVWVVEPRARTVTTHEPGRPTSVLGEEDALKGGDLLPGLEIAVGEMFA